MYIYYTPYTILYYILLTRLYSIYYTLSTILYLFYYTILHILFSIYYTIFLILYSSYIYYTILYLLYSLYYTLFTLSSHLIPMTYDLLSTSLLPIGPILLYTIIREGILLRRKGVYDDLKSILGEERKESPLRPLGSQFIIINKGEDNDKDYENIRRLLYQNIW